MLAIVVYEMPGCQVQYSLGAGHPEDKDATAINSLWDTWAFVIERCTLVCLMHLYTYPVPHPSLCLK